jgi:hypothetical protein
MPTDICLMNRRSSVKVLVARVYGYTPNDEHSVHEQFLDNIETDGER